MRFPGSQYIEMSETAIKRLSESLPPFREVSVGEDVERQARAVLSYLVDRILALDTPGGVQPVDPATCPNCDGPAESTRSPYCGTACREIAAFVRQFRTGLENGQVFDLERQTALGQVLWHLMGGGRPLRVHLIPPRNREQVLKRDGGACQVCGAPATAVDHIATGCNRPINLHAVCQSCCRTRDFGDAVVLARPEVGVLLGNLASRIGSPVALRCCDDGEDWDWRAYVKMRPPQ
jgi:5-methylcytosine-specific restriction endonuclease McrA